MLDRQKGNIIFKCDGCDEVLDTETSNFDAAVNLLNREDWRSKKVIRSAASSSRPDDKKDEWNHYCSRCKKSYA